MKQTIMVNKKTKISSQIWFALLSILLAFLYFIPKELVYPKYKILDLIVFNFLFFVLPFLVYKIIDSGNLNSNKYLLLSPLSVLIIVPLFGFFLEYRDSNDLMENGIQTKCIVIDKKKSKNDWLFKCRFYANDLEFETSYSTDEKNIYNIGDVLKLRYNKEYPRMNELEINLKK